MSASLLLAVVFKKGDLNEILQLEEIGKHLSRGLGFANYGSSNRAEDG